MCYFISDVTKTDERRQLICFNLLLSWFNCNYEYQMDLIAQPLHKKDYLFPSVLTYTPNISVN